MLTIADVSLPRAKSTVVRKFFVVFGFVDSIAMLERSTRYSMIVVSFWERDCWVEDETKEVEEVIALSNFHVEFGDSATKGSESVAIRNSTIQITRNDIQLSVFERDVWACCGRECQPNLSFLSFGRKRTPVFLVIRTAFSSEEGSCNLLMSPRHLYSRVVHHFEVGFVCLSFLT